MLVNFARRTLLVLLASAALALPANAAALKRVSGELKYKNFAGFAELLRQTAKSDVVLDLTVPLDNDEADGHLTTFVLDGQFEIAYLAGKATTKIYVDVGFDFIDEKYYTLDGTFRVIANGVEDGVRYYALELVDPANGGFIDVKIDELKAGK